MDIRRHTLSLLAPALLSLVGAPPVSAQFPPDSLVNLQFFAKDIATRDLINNMRGFAFGLGVRCQYCHVGEEGMPLADFDFPSDEKPTKRKAREMLQMMRDINTTYLANLPERSEPNVAVQCTTCHRGQARPRMIEDVLAQTIADHGLDSALTQYRALREQYHGSYTFDFSERPLSELGQNLLGAQQFDSAIGVLALNEEFFPESATVQYLMAEAYLASGERDEAIARLERTLELNPEFVPATRRLEQIKNP